MKNFNRILLLTESSQLGLLTTTTANTIKNIFLIKRNLSNLSTQFDLNIYVNDYSIIFIDKSSIKKEHISFDIEILKKKTKENNNIIVFFSYEEDKYHLTINDNILQLELQNLNDFLKILNSTLSSLEDKEGKTNPISIIQIIKNDLKKLNLRTDFVKRITPIVNNSNSKEFDSFFRHEPNPIKYFGKIITIGASIGGLEVMDTIIKKLDELLEPNQVVPPIFYTQHISHSFANKIITRMNNHSEKLHSIEAQTGLAVMNNHIYIPTREHMIIKVKHGRLNIDLKGGKLITSHIPSINVMFRSISNICKKDKTLSIILTGMGKDGVIGMGELYQMGSKTIAQEESTSIVSGIAGSCIQNGYIQKELIPEDIAKEIYNFIKKP